MVREKSPLWHKLLEFVWFEQGNDVLIFFLISEYSSNENLLFSVSGESEKLSLNLYIYHYSRKFSYGLTHVLIV